MPLTALERHTINSAPTLAITVPLSRDKAREFFNKDDKVPFGAIIVARVMAEPPVYNEVEFSSGDFVVAHHTLFGEASKIVFFSVKTREIVKAVSAQLSPT